MPSADERTSGNLLGRILSRIVTIEPRELPAVVAAFTLFFCVMSGYFAVRPVRETVGTLLGRERVADLYAVTFVAALLIIPLYGAIVARFRRSVFLPWIYGSIALALAFAGVVFGTGRESIAVGAFFYVFISVLNLFVISVFWSFLLELFNTGQTRRLFGVIAAGGTAGALIGPVITDVTVEYIGNSGILFLGASMFVIAIVAQRALLRIWKSETVVADPGAEPGAAGVRGERAIGGNPFAGFTIALRSPYLLAIMLFVFLLASVNTFLYFEQLRLVTETFSDVEQRTRFFARLDWIVQSLTIVSQLFITGRIASRLGLLVLLAVVPIAMVVGFLALAATGTLMVLAVVFVARRAGEYAFVRPAREMLFSRLDNETKYKAKNLIDVPVYRFADLVTAQLSDFLSARGLSPAAITMLGAGVALAWAVNAWWLGRRADRPMAVGPAAAPATSGH